MKEREGGMMDGEEIGVSTLNPVTPGIRED